MSKLPAPIREAYYWINARGNIGRIVANIGAYAYMGGIKLFGVKPWKDLAALCVISHEKKCVYIGIPKIATRTFRDVMVQTNAEIFKASESEKPGAFLDIHAQHPDYFSFSFVRNPWSRALSCYHSKIENAAIGKQARIHSLYKGLTPDMSFEDFVRWLGSDEGRDEIADRHWISQHLFLTNDAGEMICDYVGKYESLNDDWASICEKLGVGELSLPHKGWNSSAKSGLTDYRKHYTEETRAIIAKRYARDIELFGYEF